MRIPVLENGRKAILIALLAGVLLVGAQNWAIPPVEADACCPCDAFNCTYECLTRLGLGYYCVGCDPGDTGYYWCQYQFNGIPPCC